MYGRVERMERERGKVENRKSEKVFVIIRRYGRYLYLRDTINILVVFEGHYIVITVVFEGSDQNSRTIRSNTT